MIIEINRNEVKCSINLNDSNLLKNRNFTEIDRNALKTIGINTGNENSTYKFTSNVIEIESNYL